MCYGAHWLDPRHIFEQVAWISRFFYSDSRTQSKRVVRAGASSHNCLSFFTIGWRRLSGRAEHVAQQIVGDPSACFSVRTGWIEKRMG